MTDRPRPPTPTPDLDAIEATLAEIRADLQPHRGGWHEVYLEDVPALLAYARALEQRTAQLTAALECIRYEADMGHDLVAGRLTDIGEIVRAALAEAPDA